jgi:hypothetical protein
MERGLVERERLAFQAIPAAGIHGVGLRTLPWLVASWPLERLFAVLSRT